MNKKGFDILFLSGLFPKELKDEILHNSKKNIQNAADNLQWKFVEGLEQNGIKVRLLNSLYVGAYPKFYKKMKIKTTKFNHCDDCTDINVGFINLQLIKHYSKYFSLKKYLKEWIDDGNENKVIIAYAMTFTFLKCLYYVKKQNSLIKTVLIVPDLPEYMTESKNWIYKFLKNIEIKKINKLKPNVDYYALLTNQMAEKLNVNKYVVVEGIATDKFKDVIPYTFDRKTILYTGTLDERYGIMNLVESMKFVKCDAQLVICGGGNCVNKILQAQQKDNRIIYKGIVEDAKALSMQKGADVLINPRQNIGEYTKYSFPSKNLEYISSGNPFIGYKLDGMPDEYLDHIITPKDNTIESLAACVELVLNYDENTKNSIKKSNLEFITNEKNAQKQVEKIISLINE